MISSANWLFALGKCKTRIGLPAGLPSTSPPPARPAPLQAPYDGTPTAAVAFDHSGLYLGVGGAGEWQRLAALSHRDCCMNKELQPNSF